MDKAPIFDIAAASIVIGLAAAFGAVSTSYRNTIIIPFSTVQVVKVPDIRYETFLKIKARKASISNELAWTISDAVIENSTLHKLEVDLVLALIETESYYNPEAVSNMGALGLMQVMPFWINHLEFGENLRDPKTSIKYGTYILAQYKKMYPNRSIYLATYNQGPSTTNSDLQAGKKSWEFSQRVQYIYDQIKTLSNTERQH